MKSYPACNFKGAYVGLGFERRCLLKKGDCDGEDCILQIILMKVK